jgi:class 3 adenylate cyclase/CHASE2 domain-containing sensor protein
LVLFDRVDALNTLVASDIERQESRRAPPDANPAIKLVLVRPETRAKLCLPSDVASVPRRKYAELLAALDDDGARAALVDVMFVGKRADDAKVRSTLAGLNQLRVTLGTTCTPEDSATQTDDGVVCDFPPIAVAPEPPAANVRVGSIFALSDQSQRLVGAIPYQRDRKTGTTLWFAPLVTALQYLGLDPDRLSNDHTNDLLIDDAIQWKLSNGQMFIRPTRTKDPFRTYEFADALKESKSSEGKRLFKDSLVVIGVDLPDVDQHPVSGLGNMAGSLYLAQMVNTAMLAVTNQHHEVDFVPWAAWALLMGFLAFRSALLGSSVLSILGGLACLALTSVPSFVFSSWIGVHFPWPQPESTVIICLLTGLLFGRVWPPPTIRQSRRSDATVLFLDLVNSTGMMNDLGTERYEELFARIFQEFNRIVDRLGGVIERSTGDGFVAIFLPGGNRHHAIRAAEAAMELVEAATSASSEDATVEVSVGFETGPITGGYVRENNRRTWNSTGPTVHLAQRLEGSARRFGSHIALGPVARRYVQEEYPCEVLGREDVKGFSDPVEVSTLQVLGPVPSSKL